MKGSRSKEKGREYKDHSVEVEVKEEITTHLIERFVPVHFHGIEIVSIHDLVVVGIAEQGANLYVVIAAQGSAGRAVETAEGNADHRLIDHAAEIEREFIPGDRGAAEGRVSDRELIGADHAGGGHDIVTAGEH